MIEKLSKKLENVENIMGENKEEGGNYYAESKMNDLILVNESKVELEDLS